MCGGGKQRIPEGCINSEGEPQVQNQPETPKQALFTSTDYFQILSFKPQSRYIYSEASLSEISKLLSKELCIEPDDIFFSHFWPEFYTTKR